MIKISEMSFSYHKKEPLFQDFSLELTPGNIYGLLGKNGAGKTSLLKLISGLLFPLTGYCFFDGQKTLERKPDVLQEIIFLPENSYLPPLRIPEYLEVYSPFYKRFDKEKFVRFLMELEIESGSKISSLSYGQKKKLALAFSLAANTEVLLLDEPTNGLDIPAKTVFRKLVAESIDENKIFLISTHQVRDMKHLIDPILILDKGRIIFNQTIQAIEERISLSLQKEIPEGENVIYYESTLGGYAALNVNNNGIENEIDIELLFNAVTANHEKMNSLFTAEVVL
ncbi:MAG: ABC-2 type transport system ATP-binding protein [Stygiobacter sp.]|nr:MAG: ABC-2 type transport system ATP-binding protein [Stygiobacter sp.]KAF0218194.1 MAG: ABC-2 type transport system ATP-binding [Ignavibacteria bacterium]